MTPLPPHLTSCYPRTFTAPGIVFCRQCTAPGVVFFGKMPCGIFAEQPRPPDAWTIGLPVLATPKNMVTKTIGNKERLRRLPIRQLERQQCIHVDVYESDSTQKEKESFLVGMKHRPVAEWPPDARRHWRLCGERAAIGNRPTMRLGKAESSNAVMGNTSGGGAPDCRCDDLAGHLVSR